MNKLSGEEGISNNYSNCMLELKAKLGADEEFKKLSNEAAEIITREIAGILKDLDANPPVQSGSFTIKKSFTLSSKEQNTYPAISSYQPGMMGISDYHNLFEMQEQVKNFSSLNDLLYKFGSGGMMGGNDVGGFGNLNPMKFWQNNPMLGKTVNGGTNPTTYTVKNGDTLYTIAKNNNVSLSDLEKANPQLKGHYDFIHVGDKINIPASNSSANPKQTPANNVQNLVHDSTDSGQTGETFFQEEENKSRSQAGKTDAIPTPIYVWGVNGEIGTSNIKIDLSQLGKIADVTVNSAEVMAYKLKSSYWLGTNGKFYKNSEGFYGNQSVSNTGAIEGADKVLRYAGRLVTGVLIVKDAYSISKEWLKGNTDQAQFDLIVDGWGMF